MPNEVYKLKYDIFDYFDLAVKFIKLGTLTKYHIGYELDVLVENDALLNDTQLEDKIFCAIIKNDQFPQFRRLVLSQYDYD